MSFVIVDALEEALILAKYGRARRVSEDVDRAVAVWCFVRFLEWACETASERCFGQGWLGKLGDRSLRLCPGCHDCRRRRAS